MNTQNLQVVDTMNVRLIYTDLNGVTKQVGTGKTSKAEWEQKCGNIEIWSGVGNNKTFKMDTKKEQSLNVTIKNFDLEFLALKNGVDLDVTSKGTFYIDSEVALTTASGTITDCTRVLAASKSNGTPLKIITTVPANDNEVQITYASGSATLKLKTGATDTKILVTYKGKTATNKDNATIHLNAKAFPGAFEILCDTVVYDEVLVEDVANLYVNIYKAKMDANYKLSFQLGKELDIDCKFDVLVPDFTPDGVRNVKKDTGDFIITWY